MNGINDIGFIREHFRPLQPTVNSQGNTVVYFENAPSPELSTLIYCFWQLKTTHQLQSSFNYRVVSDGCIDILWENQSPKDLFITGFSNKYIEFPLSNSFNYYGIRFLPTAFPLLFNIPADKLTNEFLRLEEVVPELYENMIELSSRVNGLSDLTNLFNKLFLSILRKSEFDLDPRLFNAVHEILKSQGTLNLTNTLDTGISPRQLRRLFNFYIGDSPKTFSKVVRFQNILMAKPSIQSLKQNRLFYDLGYFDQAHFIKDFKYMYGLTPTIALK